MAQRQLHFYGQGKLLLTGEYFVLNGATALALPATVGQVLSVSYSPSLEPLLHWKSLDCKGQCWFEGKFEFWHFNLVEGVESRESLFLQKILRQSRKQNRHFLREEKDMVNVETKLEFPLDWGLGCSSTLIYNVAQWAYVSPFELLFKTSEGSGYDVACAQAPGPILYTKKPSGPEWVCVDYFPEFHEHLAFLYLGKKQDTQIGIKKYHDLLAEKDFTEIINQISAITMNILEIKNLADFEKQIVLHEEIVAKALDESPVKLKYFNDYKMGEIKSLGAWGGDFALVTCKDFKESCNYFKEKGYSTFLPYDELIRPSVIFDKSNLGSVSSMEKNSARLTRL